MPRKVGRKVWIRQPTSAENERLGLRTLSTELDDNHEVADCMTNLTPTFRSRSRPGTGNNFKDPGLLEHRLGGFSLNAFKGYDAGRRHDNRVGSLLTRP